MSFVGGIDFAGDVYEVLLCEVKKGVNCYIWPLAGDIIETKKT